MKKFIIKVYLILLGLAALITAIVLITDESWPKWQSYGLAPAFGILCFLGAYSIKTNLNKLQKIVIYVVACVILIGLIAIFLNLHIGYQDEKERVAESWERAKEINTIEAYKSFRSDLRGDNLLIDLGFKDYYSKYRKLCYKKWVPLFLVELDKFSNSLENEFYNSTEIENVWLTTKDKNSIRGYLHFIQKFPLSKLSVKARSIIWERIDKGAYTVFLKTDVQDPVWPWRDWRRLANSVSEELHYLGVKSYFTNDQPYNIPELHIGLISIRGQRYVFKGTERTGFYIWSFKCNIDIYDRYNNKLHFEKTHSGYLVPNEIKYDWETKLTPKQKLQRIHPQALKWSGNPEIASKPVFLAPYWTALCMDGIDSLDHKFIEIEALCKALNSSDNDVYFAATDYFNSNIDEPSILVMVQFFIENYKENVEKDLSNIDNIYWLSKIANKHLLDVANENREIGRFLEIIK